MQESTHIPVLLQASVECLLNGKNYGIYIDATLGGGGTSEKLAQTLDTNKSTIIGIDRDPTAIEISENKLILYPNFKAYNENYRALKQVLQQENIQQIDGIIFDLGVSSMQLEKADRGFSFKQNARLDMRMDPNTTTTTAEDLVNNLDEKSLRKLFWEYGEERWAGRIASKIVQYRQNKPIETTAELAELISRAVPKKFHSRRIHPATRIFQALRIEVNEELDALKQGIDDAIQALKPGGRIVVISYHSLEDRIVKHTFRQRAAENMVRIITKKPVLPEQEEVEKNPRARSAKMRVAEKNT